MPSFVKVLMSDFLLWVEARGLWKTLSSAPPYIHHLMLDRLYDWKFSTRTSRFIMLKSLSADCHHLKHSWHCEPTPFYKSEQILKSALQLSQLNPSEVVLIDFGCGTGRILMVGLNLGFKTTIGIERSENLCQVAKQNLQIFSNKCNKQGQFEIVVKDASLFEIPHEANVLYFFNPFNAQVMESVVQNILASHRVAPRSLWVIYLNPCHGTIFEKNGFKCQPNIQKGCKLYWLA